MVVAFSLISSRKSTQECLLNSSSAKKCERQGISIKIHSWVNYFMYCVTSYALGLGHIARAPWKYYSRSSSMIIIRYHRDTHTQYEIIIKSVMSKNRFSGDKKRIMGRRERIWMKFLILLRKFWSKKCWEKKKIF